MMLNNIPFLERLFGEPLRRVQRWFRSRARRALAWEMSEQRRQRNYETETEQYYESDY